MNCDTQWLSYHKSGTEYFKVLYYIWYIAIYILIYYIIHVDFPGGIVIKNLPAYTRDTRENPGSGRSLG